MGLTVVAGCKVLVGGGDACSVASWMVAVGSSTGASMSYGTVSSAGAGATELEASAAGGAVDGDSAARGNSSVDRRRIHTTYAGVACRCWESPSGSVSMTVV